MAATDSYRVAEQGGKFRVVLNGKPQSSIDDGGYNSRQPALDAAMQANRNKDRGMGSGGADKAAGQVSNRKNRMDKALSQATGE